MAAFIRILKNGTLHPVDYTAASLSDATQHEPDDGIYTVTNTYKTDHALKLDAHFDRLADSAKRADIPLQLDRIALRRALHQMIHEANMGDVRFRVTVPRHADHITTTLEAFKPPAEAMIAAGVRVITAPNSARTHAATKTTDWMHRRQQIAARLTDGLYDAILLDAEGYMLEGLGANFYAIINGELRTAGDGVLPGIAQQIVFAVAPDILPVRRDAPHISELPIMDEAFITSSSRGIVPVVEIDGQRLGDGTPGPKTQALLMAYRAWVNAHLEPLLPS